MEEDASTSSSRPSETQVPSQQLTQSKLPALHLDGGELHPGGQPWTRQETVLESLPPLWVMVPLAP